MDKKWYLSKTIWGVIVSALGKIVAVAFGVTITGAETAQIADSLVALISLLVSFSGDMLAIYGRTRVNKVKS